MFFRSVFFIGLCAVSAFAADSGTTYLALGDSIAFGFDYSKLITGQQFTGYPELVATSTELKGAKVLLNISCPGETSGSFLSTSAPVPLNDNCKNFRLSGGSLHTPYPGLQIDEMTRIVHVARKQLELVTIDIGANDLIVLQESCLGLTPPFAACIAAGIGDVLKVYQKNLGTILGTIRSAGYSGKIVLLTVYSPNYTDPVQTGAIALLNAVAAGVATKFDTKLADGFGAFLVASIPKGGDTCAAGLLLPPSPLTPPGIPCDVHPSETGARLLSQAVIKAAKSGNNNN